MAWLVLVFFLNFIEMLYHTDYCVWLHFVTYHFMLRGRKNHLIFGTLFCFWRRRESNLGRQRSNQVCYPLLHSLSAKTWLMYDLNLSRTGRLAKFAKEEFQSSCLVEQRCAGLAGKLRPRQERPQPGGPRSSPGHSVPAPLERQLDRPERHVCGFRKRNKWNGGSGRYSRAALPAGYLYPRAAETGKAFFWPNHLYRSISQRPRVDMFPGPCSCILLIRVQGF